MSHRAGVLQATAIAKRDSSVTGAESAERVDVRKWRGRSAGSTYVAAQPLYRAPLQQAAKPNQTRL